MARKTGQIIRRGPQMWMVRIYVGHDPETRKRKYIGKPINGGLRAAQAHLDHMLAEARPWTQHSLFTTNPGSISQPLARRLCPAAAGSQELWRLLGSARTVCPSATRSKTAWGGFTGRNPNALQPTAGPESVGAHDSIYARCPLLGLAVGGTVEAGSHKTPR
jgi:hypothetical protein